MKRLNEDKAASVIKPSRHSFGRALAVAAALVLLIGGAFWAGRSTVEAQTSDASESISQELDDLEAMGIDRSKAQAAFETYKRRIRDLEEQTSRTTAELYRELESTLEDLKKHAAKRR